MHHLYASQEVVDYGNIPRKSKSHSACLQLESHRILSSILTKYALPQWSTCQSGRKYFILFTVFTLIPWNQMLSFCLRGNPLNRAPLTIRAWHNLAPVISNYVSVRDSRENSAKAEFEEYEGNTSCNTDVRVTLTFLEFHKAANACFATVLKSRSLEKSKAG